MIQFLKDRHGVDLRKRLSLRERLSSRFRHYRNVLRGWCIRNLDIIVIVAMSALLVLFVYGMYVFVAPVDSGVYYNHLDDTV